MKTVDKPHNGLRKLALAAAATVVPLACTPRAHMHCAPNAPPSSTVTAAELRAAHVPGLLDAIQRVRPRFVQTHAPRRNQFAVVYMDGTPIGDVNQLRSIPVVDVVEVAFLSAPDATTRFGTDHTGGALLVRTQGGPSQPRCPGA